VPESSLNLSKYRAAVESAKPIRLHGKVTQVVGLVIEGFCPDTSVGAICEIRPQEGEPIPAEVVGFRNNKTLLMPLGELRGVGLDSLISVRRDKATMGVGPLMLGRVIDGLGNPIDDRGPLRVEEEYPIYAPPDRQAAGSWDKKHQRPVDLRTGAASRDYGRIGCRKVDTARHDRTLYRGGR